MEEAARLLPCPCCGLPAHLVTQGDARFGNFFSLGCRTGLFPDIPPPGSITCPGAMVYYTEPLDDLPAAVKAWNTRKGPQDAI